MRARASIFALILLGGCRGSGSSALPPGPFALRNAASAASISFVPIGPTRMTSGFVPNSGKVNAFAVDPSNANVLYVASGRGTGLETYSSAGIYRSRNGGASWQAVDNGLTDRNGVVDSVVNALWIDPTHHATLLAATEYEGIFRSTDGGSSWQNVYRTTQAAQFAAYRGAVYATTAAGILSSPDAGKRWTIAYPATATGYPAAIDAVSSNGGALFAGMTDGTMLRYAAGAWHTSGKLPHRAHTGTDGSSPAVHQIAIDPFDPSLIYANANDGRWDQNLSASSDGGSSWNRVVPAYRGYNYYQLGLGTQTIAFSRVHPHLLYVGLDGGLLAMNADGTANPSMQLAANVSVIDLRDIWTFPNGGDDRCWIASDQGLDDVPACSKFSRSRNDDVASKTVATGLARRFAISQNGRTIVVSLQDFDSHVTHDGGSHWRELASRQFALYEDGFNEIQPGNPNVCYAFDEASGFLVSNDGCTTYGSPSAQAAKLLSSRLMTTPLAFDPKNPHKAYVISGDIVGAGFAKAPRAVFTTVDGGATFRRLPWPVFEPGMIVIDSHDASHIIVGDLASQKRSSLRVTFDGGKTWATSRGVPVTPFWYAATISPANGNLVLATSVAANNDVFVLRSTDGGRTFTRVATVANAPLLRGRVDAGLAERLTQPPPAFVYSPARQILYNAARVGRQPYVALTTLRGAFLSTDDGSSWQRLDRDLIAHSFWGIRWNDGYLYLGSDGQGIVRSAKPVQ
ncbi:MAG TPA: hypothetical protein VFE36_01540 [Candidatus Baltobacteraceae bacterium]|nr:hypothetical protein [Candidatus Baltobacteraceae bacterium]